MNLRTLILARQLAVSVLAVAVFSVLAVDFFSFSKMGLGGELAGLSFSVVKNLSTSVANIDLSPRLVGIAGSLSLAGAWVSTGEISSQLAGTFINWFSDMADGVGQYTVDLYRNFIASWGKFLGLGEAGREGNLSGTPQDISALKEQVKKELYDELKKELLNRPGFVGVSAFPSTGSTSTDLARTKSVEQMFSDKVKVEVSPDGRQGTVKPIFRDRLGGNYLFLLSPSQ